MSELCDFGLIGLAVMGENLALNVESRGYRVAVYNRTTDKVDALMQGRAKGKKFVFVVDCSGSMSADGRLIRAQDELIRRIPSSGTPSATLRGAGTMRIRGL